MCGICGWQASPGTEPGEEALAAMRSSLAHRGPDGEGAWRNAAAGVAFGHRRLAIIDLTDASRQPMVDEAAGVAMVYNGELYNFRELREQLRAEGCQFRTTGDTEVMLAAFVAWRERAFARLCGMFAVAFYEERSRRLWLARDALGMKPLYLWRMPGGGLAFASEVKALRALPGYSPRLRPTGLEEYLEVGFVFDERETVFEGVEKLPPGEVLVRDGGGCERRFRHFVPERPEVGSGRSEAARTEELAECMAKVVEQHLIADVPVGLLLSGGLDSSLVAALGARRAEVTTVSMGFTRSGHDERPWGARVARHIGSRHLEVAITPEDVEAEIRSAAWVFDDLFADWGTITTRILYRRCRELGLKVVLVGEGADELFAGYPIFQRAGLPPGDVALFGLYRRYASRRWGRLWPRFRAVMNQLLDECGGDLFEAVRRFETGRQLPNNYVMKVDKASMSVSVEARAPYLDRRVAQIAFRTPRSLLLREGRNKYLLREAAAYGRLLPAEIVQRPKVGGSIANSWLDDVPEFRSFARQTVLRRGGFADELGLRQAMERYFGGGSGYRFPRPLSLLGQLGWRLLLLELWAPSYLGAEAS